MKILILVLILFVIIVFSGCFLQKNKLSRLTPKDFSTLDCPVVLKLEDTKKYDEKIVYVIGKYQQQDVQMRQEGRSVSHLGHVSIKLQDNHIVLMYPPEKEEAIRKSDEIKAFEGKLVKVKCVIHSAIPRESMELITQMMTPCLVEIYSIELLKK